MSRFSVMPRAYRRQLQAQDRLAVERAVRDSSSDDNRAYPATAAGDARKLRGIPAIGRNVRGAIRGTAPGDTL